MYGRYFRFERKQKEHFWNHDDAVSFRGWITCPVEEQNTHLVKSGTGKSKLAIEIGKRFGGKIPSADSMHVYKGIDILANKVTAEELSECPQHLIIENKYYWNSASINNDIIFPPANSLGTNRSGERISRHLHTTWF